MRVTNIRGLRAGVFIGVMAACLQAPAQSSGNAEDRIGRICGGLEHTVTITGVRAPGMRLSERMKFYHVPGVSVAVIHHRKLDWARGFGVARVGGAEVTPQTLFQAASITKTVTAVAALCLVRDGKINLDQDVNTYLKTWKVPENSFTLQKKVTLRELLSHTAGMSVHGFPGYRNGDPMPSLIQILNGEPPANTAPIRVTAVPGTME